MAFKVAFRLDAGAEIGLGHLMRCLAIADRLKTAGAECHFLCYQLPTHLLPLLQSHQHHPLCALDDAGPLPILRPAWLVCDHYQIDRQIEQTLAIHCGQLLVIDDLADRPHHGQLLLDQGPLRSAADYQSLAPADCRLLLGTDYALLRPAYRQLARQKVRRWQRGLICFGGADPAGACLTTLNSLVRLPWARTIQWTLVAGGANPFWPELEQRVAELADLDLVLLRQSDQMADLMSQHDFAIGAAGGMTWERACLGLPTLAVPIVDNQQFNDEVIASSQLAERLTLSELAEPERLLPALQRLEQQSDDYRRRGQQQVDGLGLDRLTAWLLPQSGYQLLPDGQQWQLRHDDKLLLTLTLDGQHLTWQAARPLQPTEWQELAHRLQTIFSQFPLYLAEPPQIAPPAPWQPAPQGWQLGIGI
ncbi:MULTISPECIES: UDP-2,4-diacetamido-2,4,6-trideoxy-beta-L-altropyranose hydrolase [unclassified Aeromonas]|uniref:UDP-2,4-diacetamido-2,4, 6-trideoxy-beta-L-altropyranose hydrolase n=1 Tax=unclassified Aeromonas TaxID=257493 RepID=UPI00084A830C|nr:MULTISPECIES: UDP-2,4-diacetamido-2,4,6-trideoxy-beta-L-altropyranose hydrolase [unclassified Aeromonas]OEC54037.1 UDP-2,4-diacetamido-2,4,6-trideoxy-beta-L-altropyranose hydrolase [Aeromonas sp. ANNP30]OEC64963.1 UDP-2,4-diacetamido-2,4,6-trideoxy-beta-L-altropyranose hydrolase [Aeromonas sp. ANP5]